jgi:hypothetical protein
MNPALRHQVTSPPTFLPPPIPRLLLTLICAVDEAKARAWAALGDMTKQSAHQLYVDLVSSIDPDWQPETCSSSSSVADAHPDPSREQPPPYRVRRVHIPPLPTASSSRAPPLHSSPTPPPTPLSHAASAAFVRGHLDDAVLLWRQLLQVPRPPARAACAASHVCAVHLICSSLGAAAAGAHRAA